VLILLVEATQWSGDWAAKRFEHRE